MRTLAAMALLVITSVGCSGGGSMPTGPESFSVPVLVTSTQAEGSAGLSAGHAGMPHNFRTHLSGGEEVPVRDTQAQGQAIFQTGPAGGDISYKLIVANIDNVTQAHIHMAAAGVNGAIVAWLYPAAPPAMLIEGPSDGVLAEGMLSAASLVGPLAGQPLSALLDAIRAGNAYVNVHTTQFPPGEIRGQIR